MFIGIDTHKDTLAVSCVDPTGKELAARIFSNDVDGHDQLLTWALDRGDTLVRVGIEGSANFGAGVARFLLDGGVDVREVPAKLTGRERTRLRRPGKSDPTDALAIARITARDEDLPPARQHGPREDLKVLVDAREELITNRTAEANRLHADLSILLPGYARRLPNLIKADSIDRAEDLLRPRPAFAPS